MIHKMKRKEKKDKKDGKFSKKATVIATIAFALFGLACIAVGFGLSNGWEWVLGWFTSQWAVYVYIFLAFFAMGAILIWWWGKKK